MPQPNRNNAAQDWLTLPRFAALLATLVLLKFPLVILGQQTLVYRDFGLFSYPAAWFQRECFWRGELPFWNPWHHCGLPFLAQWNTMPLYPGAVIYLLLPLTWSLPFFCFLHIFWGGMGMYLLARRWTGHTVAAALAGIIFAFNGLSLNFLMWPSHIATFAWLPWVLWLGQSALRRGGRELVLAVAAGVMQMLAGGPETILLTWVLLAGLAVVACSESEIPVWKIATRFGLAGLFVAMICAPQLLPFLQLLAHSQRDAAYAATTHDWSMPLWGWANLVYPLFREGPGPQGVYFQNGQYWTSSYYGGIGAVALALLALRFCKNWRVRALAVMVFLALVLAWGDTSIFFTVLKTCFPALGFARYPVKSVILVMALLPLLAAFGFAALDARREKSRSFEMSLIVGLVVFLGVLIWVDWNANVSDEVQRTIRWNGLSRGILLLLMAAAAAAYLRAPAKLHRVSAGFLALLFWVDLATHAPNQNPSVNPRIYASGYPASRLVWSPAPALGHGRALTSGPFQAQTPPMNIGNAEAAFLYNRLAARVDCNILDGVPQVDGFFSLAPRESALVAKLAANSNCPPLLDFMGVCQTNGPHTPTNWVARSTAMAMLTAGQSPVFADDATIIKTIQGREVDFRRAVWLPLEARGKISAAASTNMHVELTTLANRKLVLQSDAPGSGLVVIAQSWHPAWRAYVDDQPVQLWRANHAFQALEVPAGRHRLELRYEDRAFDLGLMLAAPGLLACVWIWVRAKQKARAVRSR